MNIRIHSNTTRSWRCRFIFATSILLNILTFLMWISMDCTVPSSSNANSNLQSRNERKLLSNLSFICDYNAKTAGYPWIKGRRHPAINLKKYCSKVSYMTNDWMKPKRYKEDDVAFIIYTDTRQNKSMSCADTARHTWASRVTHYYSISLASFNLNSPSSAPVNLGENNQTSTKKILYTLESVYMKQQSLDPSKRHKWYVLTSCDTYVNVPHFLKQVEVYDFQRPYFIAPSASGGTCYYANRTTYPGIFASGNPAHVFSGALVEALYPHLNVFAEIVWPESNHPAVNAYDAALSCLIFNVGYNVTEVPDFWKSSSHELTGFGLTQTLKALEPSTWHLINSSQMLDLDEFYTYWHVDLLANDQDWIELVDFIRLFINTHFKTLRMSQSVD